MIVLSAPRRPAFFFDAVRTLLWCDRGLSDLNIKKENWIFADEVAALLLKNVPHFISCQDLKDSTKPSYKNAWVERGGGGGGGG